MTQYMDIKDIANEVRSELKKQFPAWKFAVTIERGSMSESMTIALMSGPENPFVDEYVYSLAWGPEKRRDDYAQLNHHYIEHYNDTPYMNVDGCRPDGWYSGGIRLTEQAAEMLKKVVEIGNRRNWDHSDISTDYFDVNYYFDLHIGKWNKPFSVK